MSLHRKELVDPNPQVLLDSHSTYRASGLASCGHCLFHAPGPPSKCSSPSLGSIGLVIALTSNIVEFEQEGKKRADYGEEIIERLASVAAAVVPGRFRTSNQAVKQGRREKQRIRESGGDISAQRTQPHGCARTQGETLRNRESAERGEDGISVCEYGRNDKTPKGLPHGVWR